MFKPQQAKNQDDLQNDETNKALRSVERQIGDKAFGS